MQRTRKRALAAFGLVAFVVATAPQHPDIAEFGLLFAELTGAPIIAPVEMLPDLSELMTHGGLFGQIGVFAFTFAATVAFLKSGTQVVARYTK